MKECFKEVITGKSWRARSGEVVLSVSKLPGKRGFNLGIVYNGSWLLSILGYEASSVEEAAEHAISWLEETGKDLHKAGMIFQKSKEKE